MKAVNKLILIIGFLMFSLKAMDSQDLNIDDLINKYNNFLPTLSIFTQTHGNNDSLDEKVDQNETENVYAFCKESFPSKVSLRRHRMRHKTKVIKKCKFCKYKTPNLGHLRAHERTHTGERPYKCDICKKTFAQKSTLICHQIVHQQNKSFCECGFASKWPSSLKKHKEESCPLTKNQKMKFFCECGFKSKWRSSLKRHKKESCALRINH